MMHFAARPAKVVVDSDFTSPCDTSILYPTTGGNIHTFTAITTCAVLDVQGPPYSKEEDRDITYYRDHPYCKYPSKQLYKELLHAYELHSGVFSDFIFP